MSDEFDFLDDATPVTSASDDTVDSEWSQTDELPTAGGDQVDLPEQDASSKSVDHDPEPREKNGFDEIVPTISPKLHEFSGALLFSDSEDNHRAYWAIVSQFEPDLDERLGPFEFKGETWEITAEKTKYWASGIAAPDESFDTYNEYQIHVHADDGLKERKCNFQFKIALPDARKTNGNRISLPKDMPNGLRVQFQASNLDREELLQLLKALARHMDVNTEYFATEKIHQWSRIYQFAHYVRLDRTRGEEAIVNRGGIMDRLASFGVSSRGRGDYKWDNEEVMGHRTAVGLDESTWTKLMGRNHDLGKRAKYYHPKQVRSESTSASSDALRDPKLEIQLSADYTPGTVPWHDLEEVSSEIEETLINVLNWSGLPVRADPRLYRSDDYFDIQESKNPEIEIVGDATENLAEAEQNLAVAHFARGDATTAERKVIAKLTDGGDNRSVSELADETSVSESTVYRAIERYSEILDLAEGHLSFGDSVIREKFEELLGTVSEVADWAAGGVRQLVGLEDGILDADSVLGRWARRHGIAVENSIDGMVVDLGGRPLTRYEATKLLRAGVQAARRDGFNTLASFVESTVVWNHNGDRRSDDNIVGTSGNGTKVRVFGVYSGVFSA
jgi:transposase